MKWSELIKDLEVLKRGGDADPACTDVTYDSRQVKPGAVYVAIPGHKKHGDAYIADAVRSGAVAVVSENPQPACKVAWVKVANPRKTAGALAAKLWNIRWENMITVGITGTNGKTTVAHLFHHLFSKTCGAEHSWMFGTITYSLGTFTKEASRTTPESCDIFRFIGQAQKRPCALTMEVSSHALALDRIEGFMYDIAVFTNLTQDHLDFHGTMDEYYEAKKKLFSRYMKNGGTAVINIDDPWGKRLAAELGTLRCVTFGTSKEASVRLADYSCTWDGTEIEVSEKGKNVKFQSNLSGLFNVYNLIALWAGARALGRSQEEICESMRTVEPVHGRMQRVNVPAEYTMAVDYAHTPDALEKVLSAARPLTRGRLLCVFGCGGDRDRTKRPRMAEAVAKYADEAFITSDNPRSEEPMSIIREIAGGIPMDFPHRIEADRREAIRMAMKSARFGDCIVVAGKGHETYQEIKGVRHHFDDAEVITELGQEMKRNSTNAA
jgi:UDP-N-acetylmuramoyl-L-alanyl-D-glutamate--2,6-diaminopimelate ligase